MIASSAVIHPEAVIGNNVSIGAFSIIGEGVEVGNDCEIGSHVVVSGPTKLGQRNKVYHFCSIGEAPQDKKYTGEGSSRLEIGNDNVVREYCSINRGTEQGGGVTRLGDENWIMAYCHVAHDCMVGNNIVFANNTTLAGHVEIDDHVILGGFTGVHQFCKVGKFSFSAISSIIVKDVAPYLMVSGNAAKPSGLNREGLKRHGFSNSTIEQLKKAYKTIYHDGLLLKDALTELKELQRSCPEVEEFTRFIERSERGLAR